MFEAELCLGDARLVARADGVLLVPRERALVVGDLHLGRAERTARDGMSLLPPYDSRDTLDRLEAAITETRPQLVVCLGDSFDDLGAAETLAEEAAERIGRLTAGRRWIWVAGNHDPGPLNMPGSHIAALTLAGLELRHIADTQVQHGEVSAHYHPKAVLCRGGQRISRKCFLADRRRVLLPAFGTYTGGLDVKSAAFDRLFAGEALALLTGRKLVAVRRSELGGS